MQTMFLLLTALQLDTTIPLWGVLCSLGTLLLLAGAQGLKLYVAEKTNAKLFKDIFKELEHVRLRHQIELKAVREAAEKEIGALKEAVRENNHEIRDLRDMIMKMSSSVDLLALKEMKTRKIQ
jgi:hypothetical protein